MAKNASSDCCTVIAQLPEALLAVMGAYGAFVTSAEKVVVAALCHGYLGCQGPNCVGGNKVASSQWLEDRISLYRG
jgi:hypothetical protein